MILTMALNSSTMKARRYCLDIGLAAFVAKGFRYEEGIFAKHNLYLSQAGLRYFVLSAGEDHITHSKGDWVMFTVEDSRLAELSLSAIFHVGADKLTWVADSAGTSAQAITQSINGTSNVVNDTAHKQCLKSSSHSSLSHSLATTVDTHTIHRAQ
jgi:hypothetical protein